MKLSIIISTALTGIFTIVTHPAGSSDIFNYIISCKLAYFHHLNPYLHTFGQYAGDPLRTCSNTVNMTLGYGPAWLILSGIPFIFSGFSSIVSMLLCYKTFNALFLISIAVLIYRYEEKDNKWTSLYLFTGNPLLLYEGVVNGHNDMIMAFFLIFSVFKFRKNSLSSLPLLTASAMIKFFTLPLIVLYITEMFKRKWQLNKIILTCILSLLVIIISIIPFWESGNMLHGLFDGMNSYHTTNGISIFAILRHYMIINKIKGISRVKTIFAVLYAVFLMIEIWWIKDRLELRTIDILLFFLMTISLFYPWHLIPVLTILSFQRNYGIPYILIFTFFGMSFYPMKIFLGNFTTLSDFSVYFCLSLLMLLPVIIFFSGKVIKRNSN
jgi:hypothetical protein